MLSQWAWAMFEMKSGDVITDGDFKIEISSPGSVRDQILDSNRFWVLPQLFAELKWAENWDDNLIRVKVAKLPSFNLHKRHVQTANRPYKSAPLVKWHKMLNYSDPKLRLKMVNSVSKKINRIIYLDYRGTLLKKIFNLFQVETSVYFIFSI